MAGILEPSSQGDKPPKILVTDDCRRIRATVCALLEAWNMDSLTAEDGEAAFRSAVKHRPDLVITDLLMPRCDGYSLISRLSVLPPRHRPAIIVLSGSLSRLEPHHHATLRQADYLLSKPIRPEALFKCIARSLHKRTASLGADACLPMPCG